MNHGEQLSEAEVLESQLVFTALDEASRAGVARPVVFLLDCEDPIGREIAEHWLGPEVVAAAIEDRQLEEGALEESQTTVFAHAFAEADSRREVPAVFPYLAEVFDLPLPADSFLAIAVTGGGASALSVPLSAREP